MSQIRRELEARWHENYDRHPIGHFTKPSFVQALNLVDKVATQRAEISADVRLSDVGKRDKIRTNATPLAANVLKLRDYVADAKAAVEKQRADLAPKVKDKSDIARALLRQEVRTYLRTMTAAEAVAFACQRNIDPVALEAIFEAPSLVPMLSQNMDTVLRVYLDNNAAPQVAAIAEQAEAIKLSEAAVRIAEKTLSDAVDAPTPAAFDTWLSQSTTKPPGGAAV